VHDDVGAMGQAAVTRLQQGTGRRDTARLAAAHTTAAQTGEGISTGIFRGLSV
jgi:hypothetical protein